MVIVDISYSHMTVKPNAFISVIEWPRIPALIPKLTILIGEDDTDILENLSVLLEEEGYCVHQAKDRKSASWNSFDQTIINLRSDISLIPAVRFIWYSHTNQIHLDCRMQIISSEPFF